MYGCFSPSPLLPGVMHKLSQLCGNIEDGGTKHASVLHPWSQVSGTGKSVLHILHIIGNIEDGGTKHASVLYIPEVKSVEQVNQCYTYYTLLVTLKMGVQNMLQFNILVILVSWPSHHPIFDCLQYAKMEGEGLEIAIEQVVEIKHFRDESRCTLLHCTGWNGRGFVESGSLQPAWRQAKVVYLTIYFVLCSTLHV